MTPKIYAALAVTALSFHVTQAATFTWTGATNNVFTTGSNWTPVGPPNTAGGTDLAIINNGNSVSWTPTSNPNFTGAGNGIQLSNSSTLTQNASSSYWLSNGASMTMDHSNFNGVQNIVIGRNDNSGTASVTLTNGSALQITTGNTIFLGFGLNSTGNLTTTNSTVTTTNPNSVLQFGSATGSAGTFTMHGGTTSIAGDWKMGPSAGNTTNFVADTNAVITSSRRTSLGNGSGTAVAPITANVSLTKSSFTSSLQFWFGESVGAGTRTYVNAALTLNNSTLTATDAAAGNGISLWGVSGANNNFSINMIGASSIFGNVQSSGATTASLASTTWENLFTLGILKYNGSSAGLFSDHFSTSGTFGTAGYTLTSVPEPSTFAMGAFGLGLIVLAIRKRHRASAQV